ncbi:MAG: DEAD/DEAH box helicase [Elusimicrobiota bacterium]
MKNFKDLGINKEIRSILDGMDFKRPTEIQSRTIPAILEGRDLIGQAETGSGKTAACGIPLVQMVDKNINKVQALVLAPTRELAIQYLNEVSSIARPYGVKAFVVYGGFDISIQMAKLNDGVQILVATPGRLTDIIYNRHFPLNEVKTFVIDEADEMLKMGFIEDVDFIKKCMIHDHQTLLFSATMPAPIKKLAQNYLKDAKHIKLNQKKVQPENLSHCVVNVSRREKDNTLKKFLLKEDISQAIVFCNTRRKAERLCAKMRKRIKGMDFLHGGLKQHQRTKIINNFRRKKTRFIVTTDVMARGVDIRNVSHIINYDVSQNAQTYIHRSGRTARMGNEGICVSFVSSGEQEKFEEIKDVSDIKSKDLKKLDYGRRGRAK